MSVAEEDYLVQEQSWELASEYGHLLESNMP